MKVQKVEYIKIFEDTGEVHYLHIVDNKIDGGKYLCLCETLNMSKAISRNYDIIQYVRDTLFFGIKNSVVYTIDFDTKTRSCTETKVVQ